MTKKYLKLSAAALGVSAVAITMAIVIPLAQAPDESVAGDFFIKNVNIVDVEAGQILPRRDVTIHAGRVRQIEEASETAPPPSFRIINGSGKYIMPGLWDMHTHSYKISPQFHHPLFIANGVTGVRDMSGCMSKSDNFWACIHDRKKWNQLTSEGQGISPRYILQSSYQIDGGREVPAGFPDFFKANDTHGNKKLAGFYAAAGADFLKIYSGLSPAAYGSLAREARIRGLAIAGHLPWRVSLPEALATKQLSIEHPRLFLLECFKGAKKLRKLPDPSVAYSTQLRRRLVDQHDADLCASVMNKMANSSTYWSPTLQVLQMSARAQDFGFREDPRLKFIPFILKEGIWKGDLKNSAKQSSDEPGRNVDAEMYRLAKTHLLQAHNSGVKLLVGTDAGDTYVFPGFSVHQELQEYVAAGISPRDTLKIATIGAARFSKLDSDYGSIRVGKVADILLLRANPYTDIRNTKKIEGLFLGERYFDRSALDSILHFAERQAGSIRLNLRYFWDALSSPLMRVQLID